MLVVTKGANVPEGLSCGGLEEAANRGDILVSIGPSVCTMPVLFVVIICAHVPEGHSCGGHDEGANL